MKKIFCKKHKTICHPGGFTLCRENVTKCHIFERWRRVNESEPSPVSEQIEHTKTESLYAKLCEREGNPRQLVSGSEQFVQSVNKPSESENLSELVQSNYPQNIQMLKPVQHDDDSLSNTLTKWAQTAAISLAMSLFITAPAMSEDIVPVPSNNTLHEVSSLAVNPSQGDNSTYTINEAAEGAQNAYKTYDVREVTENYSYTDVNGNTVTKDYKTYAIDPKYNVAQQKPDVPSGGNQFWTNQYWNWNGDDLPDDVTGNYVNFKGHGVIVDAGGTIGNLTGDYLNNTDDGWVIGIYNSGTITGVTGDFVNNLNSASAQNIGITNINGTIGDIHSNFINNQVTGAGKFIYNQNSTIGNITGDFVNNVGTSSNYGSGELIFNLPDSHIGDINGNFINNTQLSNIISNTNNSSIDNINANFVGNEVGAHIIWNQGSADSNNSIGYINANFINNKAGSILTNSGWANSVNIGGITGDFINNTASSQIIFNVLCGQIGEINSNFINNTSGSDLIYNSGGYSTKIGNITGDFINNTSRVHIIFNSNGNMENITGDFIQNTASSGLIENGAGHIENITGNFIKNTTANHFIFNSGYQFDDRMGVEVGVIGDITGDFIENEVKDYDGIIFNANGHIGNLTGNFINNTSSYYLIFNSSGIIKDITGHFIGNRSTNNGALLGNDAGEIGKLTGDFIGNTGYKSIISNGNGVLGDVVGNFVNNEVSGILFSNSGAAQNFSITGNFINNTVGGDKLLFNSGSTLDFIEGDFVGNKTTLTSASQNSSALVYNNNGTIEYIHSNFINNEGFPYLIKNYGGRIGSITGHVEGNILTPLNTSNSDLGYIGNRGGIIGDITLSGGLSDLSSDISDGGLGINNLGGEIGNITADFENLSAVKGSGAAIRNGYAYNKIPSIESITGNFIKNTSAYGGAIYNDGAYIGNITGNFTDNDAINGNGGAISNGGGNIGDISANFINNSAATTSNPNYGGGGAIWNASGKIGIISNSTFKDNTGSWSGGAIYSDSGRITEIRDTNFINNKSSVVGGALSLANSEITNGIVNTNFIGNHVDKSETSTVAHGGAIYTNIDLNITADNGSSVFSGNYTESDGIREDNAIYMDNTNAVNFNLKNGGKIVMNDKINGVTGYQVNISGDNRNNTTYYMLNDIQNAMVTVNNTTLSTIDNTPYVYNFNNFTVKGDTNFIADVDLYNQTMDRITADGYGAHTGKLHVSGINVISNPPVDRNTTKIYFAQPGLKDYVISDIDGMSINTPIYKYKARYENLDDAGYFFFERGASGGGNPSNNYNPAVLASPVVTQAGAYTTQLQTFNYAFQHADTFMNIPYLERVAIINQGKYALSPTGDATDVGTYSPLLLKEESAGFWVKPYASFENVPLKNGPKVSNINYGTLVGYDSPLTSVGNGFERVLTGYIGYNGASQRYSGVDAYQNGGLLGGTATFYKGNFFNATTLSVGASAGDASTMYGSENYTMLLAGLGNKTGYNFEFFDGGMILQPSMLISYTFVNTFDYTNGAGVRIESDPMHAIQLAPGIKLIGNTKNGWQPYIGVSMVWNLLDESKVTADSVRLPEMSIKPYVQYGVGLQKRVNDKFLAFGQAMIHNGGRNGVSLSAGLRWKIGRE